ncbi:MAG TPA: PQQ-binding-like beta-propeller repeat protein [Bryobacteraceae bacterium]|jgi:PQQ-dependent dehydrogenase (methanol/ethanol family)
MMVFRSTVPLFGLALLAAYPAAAQPPAESELSPASQFSKRCEACHGSGATGTDRGPALVNNRKIRRSTEAQIRDIIHKGTVGGMPAFSLPDTQLAALAKWVRALNVSAFDMKPPGDPAAGEKFFFGKGNCASCHMVRGIGGSQGPDLSDLAIQSTLGEIEQALDDPSAPRVKSHAVSGCPGWAYCPQSTWDVVQVHMRDGSTLRGFARNQGAHDLQLQTFEGKFRFLVDSEYRQVTREPVSMPTLKAGAAERRDLLAWLSTLDGVKGPIQANMPDVPVSVIQSLNQPEAGDWPTYSGRLNGNRYSTLHQIDSGNVSQLQLQWSYQLPYSPLETTPLVVQGQMIVTAPNRVCSLDARSGREIWCYSRPRHSGDEVSGDAALGANRGAAILGDRVFFATDDAHVICLNRITGGLMWDAAMSENGGHYGVTSAPLVAGDLVISGVSGGDGPLKGFIAAYKAITGREAWRFWTLPKPGDKAAATWVGSAMENGGVATWFTGSYDPETGTLYWPTGNPYPDTDGGPRQGDNLYSNCVLALDAQNGQLRWYFQFTPHDLHDWDATEPLLLIDTRYLGRDRKLLMQANRSGFFYVLDRTNGEFLLGTPFVKRANWASGIDKTGRPILTESNEPRMSGTRTCPAVRGATNWYATAFNPGTRLFYVMATEDCNIYKPTGMGFQALADPANLAEKYLRAIDPETGKIVWEVKQVGAPETNYSGVLATAGGLLFYGETGGGFAAVDAGTGATLWHFETGQGFKASPIAYTVNSRQYVAIAAGHAILSFALPESAHEK